MIGQFIHRDQNGLLRHSRHVVRHGRLKSFKIVQQIAPEFIAVLFNTCHKPCHRLHERLIIHHSIPLCAVKPVRRIRIVLCQNDRFRIRLLDCFSEVAPELMIEIQRTPQIRRDVKAPAIRIIWRRDPFPADLHDILTKFFRIIIVQFRQCCMLPPSGVITVHRPLVAFEFKEVMVWAFPADKGAVRIPFSSVIDLLPVKPFVEGSAVIEDAVEDDLHTAFMHLFDKLDKKAVAGLKVHRVSHTCDIAGGVPVVQVPLPESIPLIPDDLSKMRIHMIVILCIIFMGRRRDKNRIQIEGFYSERLQIIQFVQYALKVPAVKTAEIRHTHFTVPAVSFPDMPSDIGVLIAQYIIGWIAIAEPVHKDLVEHSAFRPVGHGKLRHKPEIIVILNIFRHTAPIVTDLHLAGYDLKVVIASAIRIQDLRFIVIKTLVRPAETHSMAYSADDQGDLLHIPAGCPYPDPDFPAVSFFFTVAEHIRRIGKQGLCVQHRPH